MGYETLVPKMQYSVLQSQNKTSAPEVMIGSYMLTVPGPYKMEMRLQGFYPGKLFKLSTNEISHGLQAKSSVFLGGCEPRCRPFVPCDTPFNLPQCDVESFIPKSPFSLHSPYRTNSCEEQRGPLPYCTRGNHPGRWLEIPASVLATCNTTGYMAEWTKEKHKPGVKLSKVNEAALEIKKRFVDQCQHKSTTEMWNSVTNYKSDHHDHHHEDMHMKELQR